MNSLEQDEGTELTDGEYVVSSRNGCPDHFRLLVQRYQRPLFAYLSSRLGNHLEAEEAAQESFVRAFLSLKKLRKPESFYAWLLGIAARVLKEQFRAAGAPPKGPRGRGNLAGGESRERAGVSVGGSHRRPARILSSGDPACGITRGSPVRMWPHASGCRWAPSPKRFHEPMPCCARSSKPGKARKQQSNKRNHYELR